MKLEILFSLIATLALGCSEASFDAGPKGEPPPSDNQRPKEPAEATGGPSTSTSTKAKLVGSRYDAARPNTPGNATFHFEVSGLNPGETVTGFEWTVHTVDFSNITPDFNDDGGGATQKVDVNFNFKYTPKITAYQDQEFTFTVKGADGQTRSITTSANVVICDKGKSGCAVEVKISGAAGSPGAQ